MIRINENEVKEIKSLYEQESKVKAAKLDTKILDTLPKKTLMSLEDGFNRGYQQSDVKDYIENNLNVNLDNENPISTLVNMGITPYVFIVPNFATGSGSPTIGVNFKINNTPFNVSLNLGTDPTNIINALKWSMVGLNINF